MVAVDKMIDDAQEKYDERCDQITRDAEAAKVTAREEAVESIISKLR